MVATKKKSSKNIRRKTGKTALKKSSKSLTRLAPLYVWEDGNNRRYYQVGKRKVKLTVYEKDFDNGIPTGKWFPVGYLQSSMDIDKFKRLLKVRPKIRVLR